MVEADGGVAASLSPRRQQVYDLIVNVGLTNKQIARELNVSPATVKNHVEDVLHALGAVSREELIINHWKARVAELEAA